ncbi:MAG TPA: glycoside hydrolase family 3 N-terminal domain-containing protein [Solirubrobacterales bacterium]
MAGSPSSHLIARARTLAPLPLACLAIVGASAAAPSVARAASPRVPAAERAWIHRTLAKMTLEEKVGQLFVINGFGTGLHDKDPQMVKLNRRFYGVSDIAQLIRKFKPGGVIYFDWSNKLEDPGKIAALSNGIQRVASGQGAGVPMLISTDQEEGEVTRIGAPATVFPGNMALGATRGLGLTQRAARITGEELRAMGINVDNAPVVDTNLDPLNEADGVRSFGDRPAFVAKFGTAAVRGYQADAGSTGVAATAKHFPGLGDVAINPDDGAVSSPQTLAEVHRENFPTPAAAIHAGVDQVMVTHILFPKISGSKWPSSLSPFWVKGQLRGYLGYQGLITTDALDAAAVSSFPPAQVALRAFRAGNDQLLEIAQPEELEGSDKPPADLLAARRAVLAAVKRSPDRMRALKSSVVRVLRLKWKLGLVADPFTTQGRVKRLVGTPAHLAVARRAAQRSISLLRNEAGLLPLAPDSGRKVLVTGFGEVTTATLGQAIAAHGLAPQVLDTGFSPSPEAIAEAVAAARASELVVVSTFNAWTPGASQIELVNQLLATGKPVVVAAVGTPYDVAYLPGAPTFLTSYSYQPPSLDAMVEAMFGEVEPRGKLPVTVTAPSSANVLYPFGAGIGFAPGG